MTKLQMEEIAARAAKLAIKEDTAENIIDLGDDGYYKEYLDQLQNNDYQCLRTWIGWQIEEGVREAVEIMKIIIRGGMRGGKAIENTGAGCDSFRSNWGICPTGD